MPRTQETQTDTKPNAAVSRCAARSREVLPSPRGAWKTSSGPPSSPYVATRLTWSRIRPSSTRRPARIRGTWPGVYGFGSGSGMDIPPYTLAEYNDV